MRAADRSAADVDGGNDRFVRRDLVHQQAYRRDVRDGVHGADLVEMDLLDRSSVDLAFRFRDRPVDGDDVFLYVFGERQAVHDGFNVGKMTVDVAVPVFMRRGIRRVTGAFFLSVDIHMHVRARNAALHCTFLFKADAGDPEGVQPREEGVGIGEQFQEGCREHVAGGAHAAVQI